MRKEFAGGASPTELVSGIGASDMSADLLDATGWPDGEVGHFVVAIRRGTESEEKILCSSRSGSTLNFAARGFDGSPAEPHPPEAPVEHVLDADSLNELMRHVHEDETDDHPNLARTQDVPTLGLIIALGD